MRLHAHSYRLPKAGNSEAEYEDACLPQAPVDRDVRIFRAAVADGATETSFSGLWAELLVRAFVAGTVGRRMTAGSLAPLQAAWRAAVSARPLPWYAEEKVRDGAFAALLGLRLDLRSVPGRWSAVAVGDSCLAQVRAGNLRAMFPLARSADFSNRPLLASSNPARNGALSTQLVRASGDTLPGDRFFLMTDALAAWCLGRCEAGTAPWIALAALGSDAQFAEFVAGERSAGRLRNDDVTLLLLELA